MIDCDGIFGEDDIPLKHRVITKCGAIIGLKPQGLEGTIGSSHEGL